MVWHTSKPVSDQILILRPPDENPGSLLTDECVLVACVRQLCSFRFLARANPFIAGGGIVFDSVEFDEWEETINKLGANMQCITSAEKLYQPQEA
jgi:hypothetical protein